MAEAATPGAWRAALPPAVDAAGAAGAADAADSAAAERPAAADDDAVLVLTSAADAAAAGPFDAGCDAGVCRLSPELSRRGRTGVAGATGGSRRLLAV